MQSKMMHWNCFLSIFVVRPKQQSCIRQTTLKVSFKRYVKAVLYIEIWTTWILFILGFKSLHWAKFQTPITGQVNLALGMEWYWTSACINYALKNKFLPLSLSSSSTKTPHPDASDKRRHLQLVLFTKTTTSATQMRIHIHLSLLWNPITLSR